MESEFSRLLFRRQFIFAPQLLDTFAGWNYTSVCKRFHLYSHPDLPVLQLEEDGAQLTLLGYMIDPFSPYKDDRQILRDLLDRLLSGGDVLIDSENFGGRWILIVDKLDDIILFSDACGLRQVYYYVSSNGKIWCCPQPSILNKVLDLKLDKNIIDNIVNATFFNSTLFNGDDYSFPGDLSEYVGLKKLLPNHFLNLVTGKVYRFWPHDPISESSLKEGVNSSSIILKNLLIGAASRFDLAFGITAGRDTRLILAACKDIKDEIYFYTLMFPPLGEKSPDITIPLKLMAELGLKYNVIDCMEEMDDWFRDIYSDNLSSFARKMYGELAFGMYKAYPMDKVNICGNCSEIARCYYQGYGYPKAEITPDYLSMIGGWGKNKIAIEVLDSWLKDAKEIESKFNIRVLDLFYYEHKMGNWLAMNMVENDIVQEHFLPFNNRLLLTTLLSVNEKYRTSPDYVLYSDIMRFLWPEVLSQPINPKPFRIFMREMMVRILVRTGTYDIVRKAYRHYLKNR